MLSSRVYSGVPMASMLRLEVIPLISQSLTGYIIPIKSSFGFKRDMVLPLSRTRATLLEVRPVGNLRALTMSWLVNTTMQQSTYLATTTTNNDGFSNNNGQRNEHRKELTMTDNNELHNIQQRYSNDNAAMISVAVIVTLFK